MSVQRNLRGDLYLSPTPGGAYYAVSRPIPDAASRLLFSLMRGDSTPSASAQLVRGFAGDDESAGLALLDHVERLGLVTGLASPRHVPEGALVEILPGMIGRLSSDHKALVADAQGLYVAADGFSHATAEELAALSADLASLSDRRRRAVPADLHLPSQNWAIVDASGNSQLGFWPLHIGATRFVLVLAGVPALNQQEFVDVVWALSRHYLEAE